MTSRPVDGVRRRYLCRFIAANLAGAPARTLHRARAHPGLPRLPARRDRLQRLQRRARRGARARGSRGPPALPGPRPARARLGRRRRRLGRRRAGAETRREPARATVYRPDIGGLLPVYVADRYDGIEARPFPELTDAELDRYLERNVAAVREVAERVRPDVALANHLVMGPAILARALEVGVPYAVKIHGSALEYTVKPHPERFLPYAREGLARRRAACSSARATPAESLWAAMDDPDAARAAPGSARPGVDVGALRAARARGGARRAGGACASASRPRGARPPTAGSSFARRAGEAAEALGTRRARGPAGGLRRQADRLQGRRAAAGGLAARAGARARRAAGGRRLRRLPRGPGGARRPARRGRPRGRARDARRGRAASCRGWRPSSTGSRTRTPTGRRRAA